jgi:hypothetical protein
MKKVKEMKEPKEEKEKEEKPEINYSKQGKKNRAAGRLFETKVREELEKMGWIVNKWVNTIDYSKNKIVPAKRKYNPFLRALSVGTGFPDFVCFKRSDDGNCEVIGLEVKGNGYLDQVEKGMCFWLIENNIFSRILIAKKNKDGKKTEIEYINFLDKYKKDIPIQ